MISLREELAPPKPLYLGDVAEESARRHPDLQITTDHRLMTLPTRERLTWRLSEVAGAVDGWAARLCAAGVTPGGHVAVWLPNSLDILLLAWAIARAGGVPVLISEHLDTATVDALVERLTGPILVTRAARAGELGAANARAILTLDGGAGVLDLNTVEPAAAFRPVHPEPDAPALITHTSGTTGVPKLIVNTAATLGARLRPQARLSLLVRRPEPILFSIAFVHSRSYTGLTVALERGWPVIITTDTSPAAVAEVMAAHAPGIVEAPPNALMSWEELAGHPSRPLSNVRYYSSTFDAAHGRTMRTLLAASKRSRPMFVALYGQSETGPVTWRLFGRRGVVHADRRCLGHAWPGSTRVRVVPVDRGPATRERPGHLEVITRGRLRTYLGEDERFERNVDGRWWRLGDMGYRSRWGCLHLADREVDMIPGLPSTLDVEDLLLERLPALTEIVIVDDRGTPRPIVTTSGDRPIEEETWRQATRGLPSLASPIHLPAGDLPRTATWKTRRLELVERLRRGELRGIG